MKKIFAWIAVAALVAFAAPAFAANPFADVPMNHWAYDAVAQLAARGKLVGYPDGSFKGPQAATRYEVAAVVARMLANIDMEKASKQDLELLKKLVVEFKSELDALGVKVDKLDSRVAILEERIGGWKFSGNFRFTAKWVDGDVNPWGVDQDSNWSVDRFRWNIVKYVDDKVTLNVRLQGGGGNSLDVVRAYATIQFPWDITAQVGRFPLDWEGDFYATDFAGYFMNDAYVTDFDPMATAIWFKKPFEQGSFEMFVAHDEEEDFYSDYYRYGARLAFDFNENFHAAANYVKYDYQEGKEDLSTLWGDLIVNFNENIAFKGQYFSQDSAWDANAWKAILEVKQDALKFTDLWVEYAQIDRGFYFRNADPYAWTLNAETLKNSFLESTFADVRVLNIVAKQKWNDKWWTYVRYLDFDVDNGFALGIIDGQMAMMFCDYKQYTVSVRYNYTPNLWFELGYDYVDLGEPAAISFFDYNGEYDDNMIWFRTTVNF